MLAKEQRKVQFIDIYVTNAGKFAIESMEMFARANEL